MCIRNRLRKLLPCVMLASVFITSPISVSATETGSGEELSETEALYESDAQDNEEAETEGDTETTEQVPEEQKKTRRVKEEYTEKAWEAKQEYKDTSVHDLLEEYPDNGYNGYETYDEYLKSLEGDGITQEQIEQGYRVVDGYVYSPEELEGDASSLSSGARPTAMTGYINFVTRVPEGIHEATYINVINANTYEEYQAVMFEANGYATDVCLPSGNYYVSDGGLAADHAGYYYVEKSMFTVEAGKTKRIRFDIVDNRLTAEGKIHLYDRQNATEQGITYEDYVTSRYGSDYVEEEGITVESENTDTEEVAEKITDGEKSGKKNIKQTQANDDTEKQNPDKIKNLIITIIFNLIIFIPLLIFLIWYQKQKKRPEGFDE